MIEWLIANLATIIVGLILLAIFVLVIAKMVKDKKAGKSPCGCDCGSCPQSCNCHK